jgi:hypothetical protein
MQPRHASKDTATTIERTAKPQPASAEGRGVQQIVQNAIEIYVPIYHSSVTPELTMCTVCVESTYKGAEGPAMSGSVNRASKA